MWRMKYNLDIFYMYGMNKKKTLEVILNNKEKKAYPLVPYTFPSLQIILNVTFIMLMVFYKIEFPMFLASCL